MPAPSFGHPRPVTYWPDDTLELAEALVAVGTGHVHCIRKGAH